MRGRKKSAVPMESLHVRIPSRLRAEVDEELGKIHHDDPPRGALSELVTKLLRQWVKARRGG